MKTLLDVISRGTRTSEKRLTLDVVTGRDAFRTKDISNIEFIWFECNFSNSVTKQMNQAKVWSIIVTCKVEIQVQQWVVCNDSNKNDPDC